MIDRRARIVIRGLAKTFREGGREVAAVQRVDADVRDQEFVAMGVGIRQLERRLLHWRPEHRGRA